MILRHLNIDFLYSHNVGTTLFVGGVEPEVSNNILIKLFQE